MCGASSESILHLFLHCFVAESLWNSLFDIVGECWGCSRTLDRFLLTSFVGFGKKKEVKSLW